MTLTTEHLALLAQGSITAGDLLAAGFTARRLLDAGVTASDLLAAGATASDLLGVEGSQLFFLDTATARERLREYL